MMKIDMIKIKRVDQPVDKEDGFRILVDSLWPQGISKEAAKLDLWLKEIAPSNNLREWSAHNPNNWPEFQNKYREELKNKKTLIKLIKDIEKKNGTITLVYAAKDEKHNNAVVLSAKLRGYKTITTSIGRIHGA